MFDVWLPATVDPRVVQRQWEALFEDGQQPSSSASKGWHTFNAIRDGVASLLPSSAPVLEELDPNTASLTPHPVLARFADAAQHLLAADLRNANAFSAHLAAELRPLAERVMEAHDEVLQASVVSDTEPEWREHLREQASVTPPYLCAPLDILTRMGSLDRSYAQVVRFLESHGISRPAEVAAMVGTITCDPTGGDEELHGYFRPGAREKATSRWKQIVKDTKAQRGQKA